MFIIGNFTIVNRVSIWFNSFWWRFNLSLIRRRWKCNENIQNNIITGIIIIVDAIAAGRVTKKNFTQNITVISNRNKNIPKLNK
jgi:hypothetical protein